MSHFNSDSDSDSDISPESNERLCSLAPWGWDGFFEGAFAPHAAAGLAPARVLVEHRGGYLVATAAGDAFATLAGRLRVEAASRLDRPAVGDWVALRRAAHARDGAGAEGHDTIVAVLPRRTAFVRKAAGQDAPQLVAANVDVLFVAAACDGDANPRRLERYLVAARASGAEPVVVLTKADLRGDDDGGGHGAADATLAAVREAARDAPVHAVSALTGAGVDVLRGYLAGGRTVAVVGSSGVGKSTLVNRLLGASRMATQAVLAAGRGQHTTTHRELCALPEGAVLLDTPGMREFGLWDAGGELDGAFDEVARLAATCRFRDCAHEREPGCAVRDALESGALDPGRWAGYRKLRAEAAALARRQDPRAAAEARKQWVVRAREARARRRDKD